MFDKKIINKKNITTTILVILILYFCFYFLFGKYGFFSYSKTKREVLVKEQSLKTIQNENKYLENKIHSLNDKNIDKDLLDEQVRKKLGYVKENETVIYYK